MREIRTSGLMSGEGKRSDANAVQTTAPFLDSTEGEGWDPSYTFAATASAGSGSRST
jgi:hypothetical protein